MKKIDVIFQTDKLEQIKAICNEMEIKEIIFSEVMLFNSDLQITKSYRGAHYQISHISKLKAEVIIPDDKEKAFIQKMDSLIDEEKGDSITEYIVERVR